MTSIPGSLSINSIEWWDDYFKESWDVHGGSKQTAGFMEALISALPDVERDWLAESGRSILDWGCAFGEGVETLARNFPQAVIAGLDASAVALERARSSFPAYHFFAATDPGVLSDAVVCSNCLEHFDQPFEIAQNIASGAKGLVLFMVPLEEDPLLDCHLISFSRGDFPARLKEWTRIAEQLVEVPKSLWPSGRQLLVIYASQEYMRDRSQRQAALAERLKWERYYETLPLEELSAPMSAFGEELFDSLKPLLPPGAKILEAGCGGGAQSLVLAKKGHYDVTLLDFAQASLDYAKRTFEKAGVEARFERDDAFTLRSPEFDLVFNAGVLEHYVPEEQAKFLRGMASRSRRYVLVLIPNRACYWYWLWRVSVTGRDGWPFGTEVPLVDLKNVFEEAGLNYLGSTYLGAEWTENFIQAAPGLEPAIREAFLNIHKAGVVPKIQRGYLLAALGSVLKEDQLPSESHWQAGDGLVENWDAARATAALADALSQLTAADMQKRRIEQEIQESKNLLLRAEEKIEKKTLEIDAYQKRVDLMTNEINSLNSSLKIARESQSELSRIYLSRGWRLLKFGYSVRDLLFPPGSRRRAGLSRLLRIAIRK